MAFNSAWLGAKKAYKQFLIQSRHALSRHQIKKEYLIEKLKYNLDFPNNSRKWEVVQNDLKRIVMITQDAFIFPGDWKNPCHFGNKKNGFRRFLLPDVSHATQELLNSQAALLESGATSYFHWCILLIEIHSLFIVYITNLTLFVENNSSNEWIVKIRRFFLQVTPPLDKITKPFYMSTKISLKVEGSKIKNLDMKKKYWVPIFLILWVKLKFWNFWYKKNIFCQ